MLVNSGSSSSQCCSAKRSDTPEEKQVRFPENPLSPSTTSLLALRLLGLILAFGTCARPLAPAPAPGFGSCGGGRSLGFGQAGVRACWKLGSGSAAEIAVSSRTRRCDAGPPAIRTSHPEARLIREPGLKASSQRPYSLQTTQLQSVERRGGGHMMAEKGRKGRMAGLLVAGVSLCSPEPPSVDSGEASAGRGMVRLQSRRRWWGHLWATPPQHTLASRRPSQLRNRCCAIRSGAVSRTCRRAHARLQLPDPRVRGFGTRHCGLIRPSPLLSLPFPPAASKKKRRAASRNAPSRFASPRRSPEGGKARRRYRGTWRRGTLTEARGGQNCLARVPGGFRGGPPTGPLVTMPRPGAVKRLLICSAGRDVLGEGTSARGRLQARLVSLAIMPFPSWSPCRPLLEPGWGSRGGQGSADALPNCFCEKEKQSTLISQASQASQARRGDRSVRVPPWETRGRPDEKAFSLLHHSAPPIIAVFLEDTAVRSTPISICSEPTRSWCRWPSAANCCAFCHRSFQFSGPNQPVPAARA